MAYSLIGVETRLPSNDLVSGSSDPYARWLHVNAITSGSVESKLPLPDGGVAPSPHDVGLANAYLRSTLKIPPPFSPSERLSTPEASPATPLLPESLTRSSALSTIHPRMGRAMGMRSGKVIQAELGTYITLPLSGTGFVNATIAVNTVASVTEFASWAVLFREFFVKSMTLHYMPQSRYQGPIGFVNTTLTQAAGQPFLVLPVHHGISPPSTVAAAAENMDVRHVSSFDPFKFTWKNLEKSSVDTVISPVASTGTATQGWCLSDATSSAAYTGAVLFLSQGVTGSVSSAIVGQFLVRYKVLFRYRE
jgi:hypothetical protein